MAYPGLPTLYSLDDAANYTLTIGSFLHQFNEIEDVFYGGISPWTYFTTTNPVVLCIHLCIFWMILSYSLSLMTNNLSWMDRFWSLIPTSYSTLLVIRAYFSGDDMNGLLHARLVMTWFMHCLWSARLTRNYARKGGYERGSEDYRWSFLHSKLGTLAMHVLNLAFISIAQNILLLLIVAPTYPVFLVGKEVPLNWRDVVALEVLIFSLVGQLRSDDMQLRYQGCKRRHAQGTAGYDDTYREFSHAQLERGFVTTEFWRVSRHPAFFLEQVVWITFWLWSAVTTGVYFNYTAMGAAAYVVLFQCSTRLTEYISGGKYPAYKQYQQEVPMLCPIPGYIWNEDAEVKRLQAASKKDE